MCEKVIYYFSTQRYRYFSSVPRNSDQGEVFLKNILKAQTAH